MSKLKLGLMFVSMIFCASFLQAQSLDDGKKFMYYERYKSAKSVFDKLVAANPNDVDAAYWLGQSMLRPEEGKDVAGAKALYQKTLMSNSSSPLLLAGMGHVELLEDKTQDARNRFETALSLSQNKNVAVLNAIGFANVNAPKGDAEYAVEKLKLATTLKNMKDPDVWVNLGDAYKKLTQGGPAQTAYETALTLDPNYARASYRIGKIYQTQGYGQEELYMKYYNEAIAKDPKFAPVYEDLYEYFYATNVTKSAGYLDEFLANRDDDPRNCYYRASMKYAQGQFAEAITGANECLKGQDPYVKLYGLLAYSYMRQGDSLNAKSNFETYLKKADSTQVGMGDYSAYAGVLLKFPGNDSLAGLYIDRALTMDTLEANKLSYIKPITSYYEAQGNYLAAAKWYDKLLTIKKEPTKTDLHNAGYNYFRGSDYPSALRVFNKYIEKFPEGAYGYYMAGKTNWAVDSTMEQGLANPYFEKAIAAGVLDSAKSKAQLIGSYKYFIVYNVYKKNKDSALAYADRVLAIDPADTETVNNRATIEKMNFNASARKEKEAPAAKKETKAEKATTKTTEKKTTTAKPKTQPKKK